MHSLSTSSEIPQLSLNHATLRGTPVDTMIRVAAEQGVGAIGLWRDPVLATGTESVRRILDDHGMRLSSYTSGGFTHAPMGRHRLEQIDDTRRALDEAATLGAAALVVRAGGLPSPCASLAGARTDVCETIAALAPYARQAGVTLALEPLHPMFTSDRGVVSSLRLALSIVQDVDSPAVGLVVDSYNVWWDPDLIPLTIAAGSKVAVVQLADWIPPRGPDLLTCRGMIGDGVIDFRGITAAAKLAGFNGDVEVEIFNEGLWQQDPATVVARIIARYRQHVVAPDPDGRGDGAGRARRDSNSQPSDP